MRTKIRFFTNQKERSFSLRNHVISFFKSAAFFFALSLALLFFLQDMALFHPNSSPASVNYILSRNEFSQITIDNEGRSYTGFIRRNEDDEPSPLIIMFLGNAMNAADTKRFFDSTGKWRFFLNYNFLVVDYPGYGLSEGRPSARSLYEQALLAYDYAAGLPFVDENRIIVGGLSIGTGPAVYLAANRDVFGLFLLTPFASGYDLYNNVLPIFHGPLRLLVRHPFPSELHAQSITAPVLIVASESDEIVPFRSSERLRDSFPNDPTFIALSNIGHNEVLVNTISLDGIQSFLSDLEID